MPSIVATSAAGGEGGEPGTPKTNRNALPSAPKVASGQKEMSTCNVLARRKTRNVAPAAPMSTW